MVNLIGSIALAVHVLGAVVWVGGMFFAYVVLRPTAVILEPAPRLTIWAGVFKRFFPWVWMTVLGLLISGYWMIVGVYGGFANVGVHVHIMHLLGLLMMGLFIYLYYRPYPVFKAAVAEERWPDAAAALNRIRHIILVNLVLGLLVVVIATAGG